MQNAGQQYGQGGASSHPGAPYGHTDSSSNSGSITSSLRQFRKKDVEKQQISDTNTSAPESHVARVAPHNHYPPRPTECYRYPSQFQDYSLSSQVKYSEISDPQPLQEQLSPTVIQKPKAKEFMDMCNVQQTHMKQPYSDHLNGQQSYPPEPNPHAHAQYLQKDPQVHPPYKPESQYFPKESQYQQLPHQIQKYNMPAQIRKYPTQNDFLSKLQRIHPSIARSIMSDHHLQESQSSYQSMDQNRLYPHQNQRYMNYPSSMQGNAYPPSYMPPQHYTNYPSSCSYTRQPQMGPRFPSINSHDRSLSPRRGYTDNLPMPSVNYTALPQKISPNYSQYNNPEYAQHYQHRRAALPPQEYYQQHCRTTQYLPHQMPSSQEISESRVVVSDSIKQYIENWADEETASEMNQIETNRLCKETVRVRDDQSTETVFMINASELQYFENGIPVVTSENGIPLVASENGQYVIKSGVAIDNSTGMVRIVDKSNHLEPSESNVDRVVNLHIMDPLKPDCMLASKSNGSNQKQNDSLYETDGKPKVVIHQNTVIQPGQLIMRKEPDETGIGTVSNQSKIGNSLPLIADNEANLLEKLDVGIFKECKRETVDKNCSPINVEQMEKLEELQENTTHATVICPTRLTEHKVGISKDEELSQNSNDIKLKNMPIIDVLAEEVHDTVNASNAHKSEAKTAATNENFTLKAENVSEHKIVEEKITIDTRQTNEDVNKTHIAEEQKPHTACNNMDINENNADVNFIKVESDGTEKRSMKKQVVEENEEKPKIDDVVQQTSTKENSIKNEELVENKVQPHDTGNVAASELVELKTEKLEETKELHNPCPKNVTKETHIDQEEVTTESNNGRVEDTITSSENLEATNSTSDNGSSNENVNKPSIKRSRRIFSVDDIINNIGNKSKADKERAERRRSLQLTREFLEKEIDHSYTFLQKLEAKKLVIKECQITTDEEENINSMKRAEKIYINDDRKLTEPVNKNNIKVNEKQMESEERTNEASCHIKRLNCHDLNSDNAEGEIKVEHEDDGRDPSTRDIREELVCYKSSTAIVSQPTDPLNILEESTVGSPETEAGGVLNLKQTEVDLIAQNEVHYRNAIRIEENSVLLQIAGELVEINVNSVNGKKVITVVPMSETTMVDFNDNYEMLEHIGVNDQIKTEAVETQHAIEVTEMESIEEVIPQPDIIETTSEIIIGMDISLEEEIQLDLEKPQVLCTKAAKKAYENDLQIPSITTSEDINDNNKTDSYSGNDKVTSSKEQRPKDRSDKKKVDSSKKKDNIVVKRPKCLPDKNLEPDKKALRELMKVRKLKKEKMQQQNVVEEEEFVPFKDLVKARKLKKLKLLQSKGVENFTADSTNKLDQEENSQLANKSQPKKVEVKDKEGEEPTQKIISTKNKEVTLKSKEHKPKVYKKPARTDTGKDDVVEKNKNCKDEIKAEIKKPHSEDKEDNKVNSSTVEKKEAKDKGAKKVTFGPVNYYDQQKSEETCTEIRNFILQDPRIKFKPHGVAGTTKISREDERLENSKKRLSLEEYNNRKRKLSLNSDGGNREAKLKKIALEDDTPGDTKSTVSEVKTASKISGHNEPKKPAEIRSIQEKADRLKMPRPKSLDDLKILTKPKENILTKRKLSLEVTSYKPNDFDWEETQSPKSNLNSQDTTNDKHLSEFSGLINNNKSKIVIDINDLNVRPMSSDVSEDEILQNYKEQVDSKLSSLNIQIPRVAKSPGNIFNTFSKPETNTLMQRFLKNEKITYDEMEKIKNIISYKRLVQQLKKIKSPDAASSPLNPSYEIRRTCAEKEMKLHLKKVPEKKTKQRFRNLYSESTSESDSDFSDSKKMEGDYSVVQSNCFAAGVPKLIIKRKTEMPVPVVRLERLDLGLLVNKKRKIY